MFVAGYCLKEGDEAVQKLYDVTNLQRALHSCLENAPQTVLQMYIIISTWGDTGNVQYNAKLLKYLMQNKMIIISYHMIVL